MSNQEEYISLKDIFLKIGEYFTYVKSKWVWMLIVGVIIGLLMAFKTSLEPTTYSENLTFMMDESKTGDVNIPGLDALGGLFGGKKKNSLGKILQLFESKRIIHNTLFDTVVINGKSDYIANHYLDLYTVAGLVKNYKGLGGLTYKQQWAKSLMNDIDFKFQDSDVDNFSPKENLYLRIIYEAVSGNEALGMDPQLTSELDEGTGIMKLSMKSEYEDLTLSILNNIYLKLSNFFIDKSIEKETKTYNLMKEKRDSVFQALTSAEYSLADFKDSNRKLVTVKGYLRQIQLERQASILGGMYSGVVRQMDATEFALKNKTPVVQVIDLPRRPISPAKPSWMSSLILGGMMGVVLTVFYFVMRKLFIEIME